MKKTFVICTLALFLCAMALPLSAQNRYMEPPKKVMEMMTAAPRPASNFSHNNKMMAVTQQNYAMNGLAYTAGPVHKIAGIAIYPANLGGRSSFANSIYINDVATGQKTQITNMPIDAKIASVKWSPNDKYICFLHQAPTELELWRIEVATAKAQKINKYPLNSVLGDGYAFLDDERILYKAVPEGMGPAPKAPEIPIGPVIQESYGKTKSLRTGTYLLTSWYDEQLFDYYATIQFVVFSPQGSQKVGPKAIVRSFDVSPNGNYMMVTTEHKPYSYQEGHGSFPSKLELWNLKGEVVMLLEDKTKEEETPAKGNDANREPKKSGYGWRGDMPETLVWTESLTPAPADRRGAAANDQTDQEKKDEDKPEQKYTSAMYQLHAPFNGNKQLVIRPEYRIGQVTWSNSRFAIYTETSSKLKVKNTLSFVPGDTTKTPVILFSESTELDSMGVFPVIGTPYMTNNSYGVRAAYVDDKLSYIYLTGARRNNEGDNMNFIDRFDLKTKKATNLWTGQAPYNESVTAIIDFKNLKFISSKQSAKDVPNHFMVDTKAKKSQQITFYADPCPAMREIQSRFITYKRKDGVELTSMLYLPAGYDPEKDGKLPVFIWAYPREYKSVAIAERARPSRYNFENPSDQVLLATQGYAVLDGASMYIIAKNTKSEPNDVFREQLIMNAEAVINYIDSIGIGDKNRVGVGGHSYGAFMTANLLAHTKLFKAGIARSGGYNRTLTPNGFQSEPRTYWKAPQLYYEMSPFAYANQLKTPIMLIHGQIDSNNGTFPIQSERLFQALMGLGGNVRYVQLPNESHGYSAKESRLHVMYEMITFLDKHVKNAKPDKEEKPEK